MEPESWKRGRQRGQARRWESTNGTSLRWLGGHPSGCSSLQGPGSESCCWYLPADNFPAPPTAVCPLGLCKKKEVNFKKNKTPSQNQIEEENTRLEGS